MRASTVALATEAVRLAPWSPAAIETLAAVIAG
jgi:hypothetical protein